MEKIISSVRQQIELTSTNELEEKIELLNSISNRLKGIDLLFLKTDISKLVKVMSEVQDLDIIYGYLLTYYDFPLEKVKNYSEVLIKFFENNELSYQDKKAYITFLLIIKHTKRLDDISIDTIITLVKLEMKIITKSGEEGKKIIEVLHLLAEDKNFLDYFDTMRDGYCREKPNIDGSLLKEFCLFLKVHYHHLDAKTLHGKEENKVYNYIISLSFSGRYLIKDINKKKQKLRRELQKIQEENKEKEKKISILQGKFSHLFSKEMITKSDVLELRNMIEDDSLFHQLLIQILEHNQQQFELFKGEEHSSIRMKLIFQKYHYDYLQFSEKDQQALALLSSINLIALLEKLSQNQIRLPYDHLAKVCMTSNLGMIDRVTPLIERGYLNSLSLNREIELLCCEDYQERFFANISTLLEHSMDVKQVLESGFSLGSINPDELLSTLHLLDLYQIQYQHQELHHFDFLEDSSCLSIIDGFIEEGFSSLIQEHPEYLRKNNSVVPKRIHIQQLIDEEVMKKERLDSQLLYEHQYFLKDSQLDSFCCSHTLEYSNSYLVEQLEENIRTTISDFVLHHEMVQLLDQNFMQDGNYLFGDVIISRMKFLRNFEVLYQNDKFSIEEIVFNCLIFNSLLTDEELLLIRKSINNLENQLTFVKK